MKTSTESNKKHSDKVSIYQNVRTDKDYRASTGMDKSEFDTLFLLFEKLYNSKKGSGLDNLNKPLFTDKREALFFILYYLKTYPTFQILGLQFGISEASAYNYVKMLKPFLMSCLNAFSCQPVRLFDTQEEFDAFFEGIEIFIDGTELRTQRPCEEEKQKENYSGKKKDHTRSWLVICDKNKRILFLSDIFAGKRQDFGIFKEIFKDKDLSKIKRIFVDLGFVGINTKFKHNDNISIPHKRSKKVNLTDEQREENRIISRDRIVVENSLSGVKRGFSLKIENRQQNNKDIDDLMVLGCALWNFKLYVKNINKK